VAPHTNPHSTRANARDQPARARRRAFPELVVRAHERVRAPRAARTPARRAAAHDPDHAPATLTIDPLIRPRRSRLPIGSRLARSIAVLLCCVGVFAGPAISGAFAAGAWNAQTSRTTNHLWGVSFVDASHGWAVGTSGTIVATTDGGTT
jgi:hypothetical protein